MITKKEADRLSGLVESLLVYESLIEHSKANLDHTEEASCKTLMQYMLGVNQRNAEETAKEFRAFLTSITEPDVPRSGGWISCEERLPPSEPGKWSEKVMALGNCGYVFTLSVQGDYWQRSKAFVESESTKITHWQPLVYPTN